MLLAKEKASHYQVADYGRKNRKKVRTVRKYKKNPKIFFAFFVVAAFLLGLFLASKYAQLAISGYQIGKMKATLARLQMENEQLTLEVAKLQSLDRIEKIAVEKLGMTKPEGVQYVAVEPIPVKAEAEDPASLTDGRQEDQATMAVHSQEDPARGRNVFLQAFAEMVGNWSGRMAKAEAGGR